MGGIHVPTWLAKERATPTTPVTSRTTFSGTRTSRTQSSAMDVESTQIPTRDCGICLNNFKVTDMYTMDCPSAHRFCYECLRELTIHSINEHKSIICPDPSCKHILNEPELRIMLRAQGDQATTNELLTRYQEQTLKRTLESMKDGIACPSTGCDNWIIASSPGEREACTCNKCNFTFCSICKEAYHYRCECGEVNELTACWIAWNKGGREEFNAQRRAEYARSTEEYDKQRKQHEQRVQELDQRFKEATKDEEWKAKNTKLCPHCRRAVEKLGGCDLMVCGRNYHGGDVQNGCGQIFRWSQALPYAPSQVTHLPSLGEFAAKAPQARGKDHGPFACDSCHKSIQGIRFSCIHCAMFDLCEECEMRVQHPSKHVFRLCLN